MFTPKIGKDSHCYWYFSTGLKPPTSFRLLLLAENIEEIRKFKKGSTLSNPAKSPLHFCLPNAKDPSKSSTTSPRLSSLALSLWGKNTDPLPLGWIIRRARGNLCVFRTFPGLWDVRCLGPEKKLTKNGWCSLIFFSTSWKSVLYTQKKKRWLEEIFFCFGMLHFRGRTVKLQGCNAAFYFVLLLGMKVHVFKMFLNWHARNHQTEKT